MKTLSNKNIVIHYKLHYWTALKFLLLCIYQINPQKSEREGGGGLQIVMHKERSHLKNETGVIGGCQTPPSNSTRKRDTTKKTQGFCRGINVCMSMGSVVSTKHQPPQQQHHQQTSKLEQQVLFDQIGPPLSAIQLYACMGVTTYFSIFVQGLIL